jgi:hypothetical protein
MFEIAKCGEIAQAIKQNDRKMKAKLDFMEAASSEETWAAFWEALGGKPTTISPAVPDEGPSATEDERMAYKLFHISDSTGSMVTTEVTARPLTREHLNDSDSYILELYDTVYIWQGKDSSAKEKYAGMKIAKDFVKTNNKPKAPVFPNSLKTPPSSPSSMDSTPTLRKTSALEPSSQPPQVTRTCPP